MNLPNSPGSQRSRLATLTDLALIASVIVMAGVLVKREFFPRIVRSESVTPVAEKYEPAIDSAAQQNLHSAKSAAPARLVVFNDLECPFCAAFHEVVRVAVARHGDQLSVKFLHFPLSNHRFARPSAVAVECAGTQGRFDAMTTAIFRWQDSLGLVTWDKFAKSAEIPDTTEFRKCRSQTSDAFPQIDADVRLGKSAGVSATPTVFLNGWKLSTLPDSAAFDALVRDIKAGRSKFVTP